MQNRVKYLRRSEGFDLTQEELAIKLGVSRQTIVAIESGANTSAEIAVRIARLFGKDVGEIFFDNPVEHSVQNEERCIDHGQSD